MFNAPKLKIGIVAVSRDCFPESLSVNRRKALIDAYKAKYGDEYIYECPICIVESEIHMKQALADIKAQGANGNQPVDPAPFTYPGPNPQTKEAAIMMMADACEAATRSLKEPDEKAIAAIVEKVINGQIVEGLLDEAPISFKDVGIIKRTFIERLRTFYHLRIAYPDDVVPPTSSGPDDPED